MNNQLVTLSVNKPYPYDLNVSEGAISNFLVKNENRLIIAMPNISKEEAWAFKKGAMRCGMLAKNGAILFIWQFFDKKVPVATLDSPFDARLINNIDLHNIENEYQRLSISVDIVDTATNLVRGLRLITMPPNLTVTFLSAVQDQLASAESGDSQYQIWMTFRPDDLAKQTKMWDMGQ